MGWGAGNTPGGPVEPFSEPVRIHPEQPRRVSFSFEEAAAFLRQAGYVVEKRDDLVNHIAAAVRAEMVLAPETMFRDAQQIGENVLRIMAEYRG